MTPGKEIFSMAPQKDLLRQRGKVFSPLELYKEESWQMLDPTNTVYVSGSASSGGYRALLQLWGKNELNTFYKPRGYLQSQIIKMNTALITDMMHNMSVPEELNEKTFFMPHSIGTDIPEGMGTLMGTNEAHLMMQWMMRISGMTIDTATQYCNTMETEYAKAIATIGDPTVNKKEKVPHYVTLMQTALATIKLTNQQIKPLSAMILGLDWKHSLGSRLEAALALRLGIPVYEMRLNLASKDDYDAFIDSYRLRKILPHIHFPTFHEKGAGLIAVQPMNKEELKIAIDDAPEELRFPPNLLI